MATTETPTSCSDHTHDETTTSDQTTITITLHHRSTPHTFTLPSTSQLSDLTLAITETLHIPPQNQKLLLPRHLSALAKDGTTPLTTLFADQISSTPNAPPQKKTILLGATVEDKSTADRTLETMKQRQLPRVYGGGMKPVNLYSPSSSSPTSKIHTLTTSGGAQTTPFGTLEPLPYLPSPHLAHALLTRLTTDRGILHLMHTHSWHVPVVREMSPLEHTTHHGVPGGAGSGTQLTLGLNINAGERIELRLRTDEIQDSRTGELGWRDYRTVRRTLVHELVHNVFGEHDGRFWEMYGRLVRVVEGMDKGGRVVGGEGEGGYVPPEEEELGDGGAGRWVGGEQVLGGGGGSSGGGSREEIREALARAAEERARRVDRRRERAAGGSGESGSGSGTGTGNGGGSA
ncbi:putative zinc metallo proteinase [Peziza echinospora]|nr:putative zinc metallo proteinase [Peziza echinospora]